MEVGRCRRGGRQSLVFPTTHLPPPFRSFMATISDLTTSVRPKKDITRRDLDVFFKPRSVAAIGATDREGHVGRSVLWNLISSPFGGTVYPVNPKKNSVLGIKAYPNVTGLPEPP